MYFHARCVFLPNTSPASGLHRTFPPGFEEILGIFTNLCPLRALWGRTRVTLRIIKRGNSLALPLRRYVSMPSSPQARESLHNLGSRSTSRTDGRSNGALRPLIVFSQARIRPVLVRARPGASIACSGYGAALGIPRVVWLGFGHGWDIERMSLLERRAAANGFAHHNRRRSGRPLQSPMLDVLRSACRRRFRILHF